MNESTFLKNNIAIVLAGEIDCDLLIELQSFTYIIAVDGGYNHLSEIGLKPDVLIGDLDSVTSTINCPTVEFDPVKDDTDFKCAINYAVNKFEQSQITVYGFASLNRIDHVIANLANLQSNITLKSANQQITIIDKDTKVTKDEYTYISFFSIETVSKFSLDGFKYPLTNYQLNPFDPLCVSNELIADSGKIRMSNGSVIVIKSKQN